VQQRRRTGERTTMTTDDNKKLVRRWLEAVDTADPAVIDEYLAPSFHDNSPPPFPGAGHDLTGARGAFEYALSAFTNFRHEIPEQWAEGDTVISRIVGFGTHSGDFLGIPATGKDVAMEGIAVHRIAEGKIVEHRSTIDVAGLLIQLGVLAPPGG
jgi:predicted ester cyclase